MSLVRLNKVLAQSGYGSRRACDDIIATKRVTVNHRIAILGDRVLSTDAITVDGKPINRKVDTKIIIKFNKPKGIAVTKKDRFSPVTVMDYLPPSLQHLNPVGRLDKLSSGLLIMTNDGELANELTHPRFFHDKEYRVVFAPLKPMSKAFMMRQFDRLTSEMVDPSAQSYPIQVRDIKISQDGLSGRATIILTEGKNRQIRRLF